MRLRWMPIAAIATTGATPWNGSWIEILSTHTTTGSRMERRSPNRSARNQVIDQILVALLADGHTLVGFAGPCQNANHKDFGQEPRRGSQPSPGHAPHGDPQGSLYW